MSPSFEFVCIKIYEFQILDPKSLELRYSYEKPNFILAKLICCDVEEDKICFMNYNRNTGLNSLEFTLLKCTPGSSNSLIVDNIYDVPCKDCDGAIEEFSLPFYLRYPYLLMLDTAKTRSFVFHITPSGKLKKTAATASQYTELLNDGTVIAEETDGKIDIWNPTLSSIRTTVALKTTCWVVERERRHLICLDPSHMIVFSLSGEILQSVNYFNATSVQLLHQKYVMVSGDSISCIFSFNPTLQYHVEFTSTTNLQIFCPEFNVFARKHETKKNILVVSSISSEKLFYYLKVRKIIHFAPDRIYGVNRFGELYLFDFSEEGHNLETYLDEKSS
jgi:hypothetical protein